jgi:hypothetical protein
MTKELEREVVGFLTRIVDGYPTRHIHGQAADLLSRIRSAARPQRETKGKA